MAKATNETKMLGIPRSVRTRFFAECRNVLLDTRTDDGILSPARAALLLRQRLLGGVQTRLSFQITPDPLTDRVTFDEDALFILHDAAWNHLVGFQMQQTAQTMKIKLDSEVENNEDALESLRENCYAEIVTYKSDGKTIFKFVGDASMGEIMLAAEQFAEKKRRAGKRESRANAIVRRMRVRGATEQTTVSEALERKPGLRAVR